MNKSLKSALLVAASLSLVSLGSTAEAKGCVRGAVAGAVAGHYAHHHAVAGALAGCAAGHYYYKHKAAQNAHATAKSAPKS